MNPHIKEMVDGKGYKIVNIDYAKVKRENKDVDIESCEEMQAVLKAHVSKLLAMKDNPFTPIFECGELNDRGYPIDARYAFQIGKKTNRFQATIERPLMPNSMKTLKDSSTESRLYRVVTGIVNSLLNKGCDYKYITAVLNIIMTTAFGREQMRHFDLTAYYDKELMKKPGISILIPIDDSGVIEIWEGSHKYVHDAKKVEAQGTASHLIWSEFRKLVGEIRNIAKTSAYFGTDEMCMVLDNTVHAGAKNVRNEPTFRLHIYVVIEGTVPNTMDTNVPCEIVWDLTREGAMSEDFFSSITKVRKGDEYAGEPSSQKKKRPLKQADSDSDTNSEPEPPSKPSKRARGRPRKYDL